MKAPLNQPTKLFISSLTLCVLLCGAIQGYSQPTVPANTPTLPQTQVIAIYNSSGTYTNIPVPAGYFNDWYNPGGCCAGFYNINTGAGPATNVLLYPEPVIIWGIDFSANPYNMSGCDHMHVDIFAPDATNYDIRIVNTVENQQADAIGFATTGGWTSLDIPLSVFTSNNPAITFDNIGQVGIVGDGTADSTYYIDNIYFAGSTNLVFVPPPAVPAPTNNAPTPGWTNTMVQALYDSGGTYTEASVIDWPAPWSGSAQSPFTITNTGNIVEHLPGLTDVGEDYYSPDQIDTTGFNTMHIDLWTANGNQFYVQLVSLSPTESAQVGVFNMATNQWVGFDIPLSEFAAVNPSTDLTAIQQILWVDNIPPGLQNANFYFDNVYFYNRPASPVMTASLTSGTNYLSFPTQNGFNYTVQYTTNLTSAVWQALPVIVGDGSIDMVGDTATQSQRFYRLSIQ